MTNRLYYGDSLDVLRGFPDASIEAFDHTCTWGEASKNALLYNAADTNHPVQVKMR